MNDASAMTDERRDQADEDLLVCGVSDEGLEAAGGRRPEASDTLLFKTFSYFLNCC